MKLLDLDLALRLQLHPRGWPGRPWWRADGISTDVECLSRWDGRTVRRGIGARAQWEHRLADQHWSTIPIDSEPWGDDIGASLNTLLERIDTAHPLPVPPLYPLQVWRLVD